MELLSRPEETIARRISAYYTTGEFKDRLKSRLAREDSAV